MSSLSYQCLAYNHNDVERIFCFDNNASCILWGFFSRIFWGNQSICNQSKYDVKNEPNDIQKKKNILNLIHEDTKIFSIYILLCFSMDP